MCINTTEMRTYYNEFRTVEECEQFITFYNISEENIIDTRLVAEGLYCMWHYA